MSNKEYLRFGYFCDFYEPTFVFLGDENSLGLLRNALLALPSANFFEIGINGGFQSFAGEFLVLRLTERAGGFKYCCLSQPVRFEWCLSEEQASMFAQKIQSVIDAPRPCHDYLDTGLDDVLVLVSKGEYPIGWPGG